MKKILLVLSCIISSTAVFSKNNEDSIVTNFLEDGTAWVTAYIAHDFMRDDYYKFSNYAIIDYYYIDGDTIINGEKYKNVSCTVLKLKDRDDEDYLKRFTIFRHYNIATISQDTLGVLSYHFFTTDGILQENLLLYDFNKEFKIGNTIKYCKQKFHPWGFPLDTIEYADTITSIDTMLIGNRYNVVVANDKYIYGLGHKDNPLCWVWSEKTTTSGGELLQDIPPRFLCLYYKGEIILQNEELVRKFCNNLGIDVNKIILPSINAIRNNAFFDLQGRKVKNPTKGLYIKDGKKVVVK